MNESFEPITMEELFGKASNVAPQTFKPITMEELFPDMPKQQLNPLKDVTGLGTKQAEDFNHQLATRKFSPVQAYQQFENYGKKMSDYYTEKGYSPQQIEKIKKEFVASADPRNKTNWWDYYVSDRANDVMVGTGNLLVDALAAVPENIPVLGKLADDAEKYTRDVTQAWQNAVSDKQKIQTYLGERAEKEALANGAGELGGLWANLKENPMQMASLFSQQAPQLALGALGKIPAAITYMMGGAGRVRNDIEQAYEDTYKNNPAQLLQLPEIQSRMKQGMSFEQAVNDAKTDITDNWKSIVAGAAIAGTEALAPFSKVGQGVNRGVVGTFAKEIGQEAFQEGAEQLNSNLAVGQIDGKTQAFDNVVRNAALGGIAGGLTGIPSAVDAYLKRDSGAENLVDQLNQSAQQGIQANEQAAERATQGQNVEIDGVNQQVLEQVVSGISDQDLRDSYYDELKKDIQDGVIEERANSNSTYGKLAREYLQQTQAQAQPEVQLQATHQTDNASHINPEIERVLDLRKRMMDWRAGKKVNNINDLLDTPMSFANQEAKRDFAIERAFGEVQAIAEKYNIDPNDGKAMRQWLEDYIAKRDQAQSEAQAYSQAVNPKQNVAKIETETETAEPITPDAVATETQTETKLDEDRLEQYRVEVQSLLDDNRKGTLSEQDVLARYTDIAERFPEHHELSAELYRREQEDQEQQLLYSRSPMKSVEANITRGRERMTKAILDKADVKRGMYNHEFGWVDFVWGDDGTTKPLGRNGEPRGRGISHIFEARERKDGQSYQQTSQMLVNDIVNTVAKGSITSRTQSRIVLEYKENPNDLGHKAILTKDKDYNGNSWILTAFENDPKKGRKANSEGETKMGYDKLSPTHSTATLSRDAVGASEMLFGDATGPGSYTTSATEINRSHSRDDLGAPNSKFPKKNMGEGASRLGNDSSTSTDTSPTLTRADIGASPLASDSGQLANANGLSNDTAFELGRPTSTSQLNDTHAHSQRGRGVVAENGANLADNSPSVNPQPLQDQQALSRLLGEDDVVFDKVGTLEQAKNVSESDIRHSLNENIDSPFAQMVDRVIAGYQGSNKRFVKMGTTPDVLKMLGFPDTTVSMREDVFNKVLGNKHFLTPESLKRLPEQLNNPIAVTRSRTIENGYLVFTELTENVSGVDKPIAAALHVKVNNKGIDVIDVASAYGRNVSQINEDLKHTLYWNKQKGYPFANRAGLQLPNVILSLDNLSTSHIKTEEDLSQYQSTSQSNPQPLQDQQALSRLLGEEIARHIEVVDRNTVTPPKGETIESLQSVEGWYDKATQKAYIYADGITADFGLTREERLAWVAWHELAHKGLDVKYRNVLNAVLKQAKKHPVVAVISRRIQESNPKYTENIAIEEALVELYSAYQTGNWDSLNQRYNTRVHPSYYLNGKSDMGNVFQRFATVMKRLIANLSKNKRAEMMAEKDLFDLLKRIDSSVMELANSNPTANTQEQSDVHYSLNENADSDFAKAVDAVANGERAATTEIVLGTTPDVLKMLGVDEANVIMHARTLQKDMIGKHSVSAEAMKQLPKQMNDPVAVMRSRGSSTNPDAYLVLTELKEVENGKELPIIAALSFEKNVNGDLELINVASAYGRKNVKVAKDLEAGTLYWHREKGNQFFDNFALSAESNFDLSALRSSLSDNDYLSENNIKTETDLSQYQDENLGNPTANTQEQSDVHYSLNENADSDFAKAIPKRTANSYDEARSIVSELLGEPLVNKETGMVATISRRSLDKLLSGKAVDKSTNLHDHLTAVANIDQLFENAMQGWIEPDKNNDPNIAGVHRLFAPLNIDGQMRLAKLTVKAMSFNQGNRVYSVETIEVENENSDLSLSWKPQLSENTQLTSQQIANIESLIQRIKDFNSQDKNSTDDDVRFSRRPKSESLEKLRNAETIRISGKDIEPSSDLREYKRNALNYGKTLRGTYVNKDTGQEIAIGRAGIQEILRHDYKDPDHLQSIAAIPQIIEQATYIDTLPNEEMDKNPDISEYEYYVAGLNIAGDDYVVKAVVGTSKKNGERYYDHKLTPISKNELLSLSYRVSTAGLSENSSFSEKGDLLSTAGITTPSFDNQSPSEKGDLLSLPSRITNPVGESLSPLSEINDKRLLQILQDENLGNDDGDNVRYSRKQSALEQARNGKADARETLRDEILSFDRETYKDLYNRFTSKVHEAFADSRKPVIDFIHRFEGVADNVKQRIVQSMQSAENVRDVQRGVIEENYAKPIIDSLVKLGNKSKLDLLTAKRLAGFWISARWSIQKNQMLLDRAEKSMLEAKDIYDSALQHSQDQAVIDRAELDYIKARNHYNGLKHDVELDLGNDYSNKSFKVGVAGGWSIPEAKLLMKTIEGKLAVNDLQALAEQVYDLNQALLKLDEKSGRYTDEELAEYRSHRQYVPLTGDPSTRTDDIDFIGGVAQKAFNIGRDKALKGRQNSEAEDAFDAMWKNIGKTTQYYGWADFKQELASVFDERVADLEQSGYSKRDAKNEAAKQLGFNKQGMSGLTRTSDNVLTYKDNGKYYEIQLPATVADALRGDNRESSISPLVRAFDAMLAKPTKLMARGITQLSFDFPIVNMIRDVMGKAIYIAHEDIYDQTGKPLSAAEKYAIGFKVYQKALSHTFNIGNNLFAATFKHAWGAKLKDSGIQGDLKELIEYGGFSNFTNNLARSEADFVKQLKQSSSILSRTSAIAKHLLNTWGGTFDAVSSLVTYKALKDSGIDPKQAAGLVLETANFRKQGASLTNARNAFMFLQPKMMDAQKMARIMHTKRGALELLGRSVVMAMLYAAIGSLWSYVLGDDAEDDGGSLLAQLGDITGYVPIPLPESVREALKSVSGLANIKGNFFKLHLGFGMNQIAWNNGFNLVRAIQGEIKPEEAVVNIGVNWIKNFAPVTPSEVSADKDPINKMVQTFTPTALLPIIQSATNRSAFGSTITPTNVNNEELKATQAKPNTAPEWEAMSTWIFDNMGVDLHPETVKHFVNSYGIIFGSARELINVHIENPNRERLGKTQRVPFLTRFIGMPNENSIPNKYYEAVGESKQATARYNRYKEIGDDEKMKETEPLMRFNQLIEQKTKDVDKQKRNLRNALNKGRMSQEVYDRKMLLVRKREELIQRALVRQYRQDNGLYTKP